MAASWLGECYYGGATGETMGVVPNGLRVKGSGRARRVWGPEGGCLGLGTGMQGLSLERGTQLLFGTF